MQYIVRTAIEVKGNTLVPQTLFSRRTDIRPPWAQLPPISAVSAYIVITVGGLKRAVRVAYFENGNYKP